MGNLLDPWSCSFFIEDLVGFFCVVEGPDLIKSFKVKQYNKIQRPLYSHEIQEPST